MKRKRRTPGGRGGGYAKGEEDEEEEVDEGAGDEGRDGNLPLSREALSQCLAAALARRKEEMWLPGSATTTMNDEGGARLPRLPAITIGSPGR